MSLPKAFPDADSDTAQREADGDWNIDDHALPRDPLSTSDDYLEEMDEIEDEETPRIHSRRNKRERAQNDNTDDSFDEGDEDVDGSVDDDDTDSDDEIDFDDIFSDDDLAGEPSKDSNSNDSQKSSEIPEIKLDPDLVDKEIIDAFSTLTDVVRKQAEQIERLTSSQSTQREASALSQLDAMFGNLNKPLRKQFGESNFAALKPGSKEYKARHQVVRTMKALSTGYKAVGLKRSPEQIFSAALRETFPDLVQSQERRQVRQQVDRRRKSAVNRARGGRAGGENDVTRDGRDPRDKAIASIKGKLDEWFN